MQKSTGRPAHAYKLADIGLQVAADGMAAAYRALQTRDIADPVRYRALAYAPLVAGTYKRRALAKQIGVSASTARRYDTIAGVTVTEQIRRETVTERDAGLFSDDRRDWPMNAWLESTAGDRLAPTQDGFRNAIAASVKHDGRAVAVLCRQRMNHYTPPERDTAPLGLPVQYRQALIRDGKTNLARVIDALLLAGVKPGRTLTTARVIEIAGRYGIGESSVRRALAGVATTTAAPRPKKRPQAHRDAPHGAPAESPTDYTQQGLERAPGAASARPCQQCGAPAEPRLTGVFCDACWESESARHRARRPRETIGRAAVGVGGAA